MLILRTEPLPIFSPPASAERLVKPFPQEKFKGLAIMRSHGGRVRAIESGETRVDIAFIGTPTADDYGNAGASAEKSDCGVLSYAMVGR